MAKLDMDMVIIARLPVGNVNLQSLTNDSSESDVPNARAFPCRDRLADLPGTS